MQLTDEKLPLRLASDRSGRLIPQLGDQYQRRSPDLRQAGGILMDISYPLRRAVAVIDRIRISLPESHRNPSVGETYVGKRGGLSLRAIVTANKKETAEQKRADFQAAARGQGYGIPLAGKGVFSGCQQRGDASRPPWFQKASERRPAFWPGIPRLRTFFDWEES